ncbi:MAG: hypothetical protein R2838_14735 [Caldilineaceae bacterium]
MIPVAVRADYFFGQPVAAAAVKLQIYRTPIFGGYGYYGDDIWWPGPGGWETLVDEETGITDADGTWSLDYPLPADDAGADWSYRFVAAVTDARNTPIEGSVNVAVYWSELQLDVTTPRYGYAAGTPVDMTIRARDRAGAPLAAQEVTLRLNRGWGKRRCPTSCAPSPPAPTGPRPPPSRTCPRAGTAPSPRAPTPAAVAARWRAICGSTARARTGGGVPTTASRWPWTGTHTRPARRPRC